MVYQGMVLNITDISKIAGSLSLDKDSIIIDINTKKEIWNNQDLNIQPPTSLTGKYAIISYKPKTLQVYSNIPTDYMPSYPDGLFIEYPYFIRLNNSTSYVTALSNTTMFVNGLLTKSLLNDVPYTSDVERGLLNTILLNVDSLKSLDIFNLTNPTTKLDKTNLILKKDTKYILSYNGFTTLTTSSAYNNIISNNIAEYPIFRKPDGTYVDARIPVNSDPISFIPASKISADSAAEAARLEKEKYDLEIKRAQEAANNKLNESNNTTLWISIGLGASLLVVGAYAILKK